MVLSKALMNVIAPATAGSTRSRHGRIVNGQV